MLLERYLQLLQTSKVKGYRGLQQNYFDKPEYQEKAVEKK